MPQDLFNDMRRHTDLVHAGRCGSSKIMQPPWRNARPLIKRLLLERPGRKPSVSTKQECPVLPTRDFSDDRPCRFRQWQCVRSAVLAALGSDDPKAAFDVKLGPHH